MGRSRRRTRQRRVVLVVAAVAVAGAGGGWWYLARAGGEASQMPSEAEGEPSATPLVIDAQEDELKWAAEPAEQTSEVAETTPDEILEPEGAASVPVAPAPVAAADTTDAPEPGETTRPITDNASIAVARQAYAAGKLIEARHALNGLLATNLSHADETEVRRLLTTIADETVFSRRRVPNDPLAETYVVQRGDALVRIGRTYEVPAEVLMQINGIRDATRLRAEQPIKVLHGPFHVKISKSHFRLDVYLQDVYVRSYRVALGADQGTPGGVWRVKERLENPTYYPPASAPVKRVVPPDDPDNPLGEHWIGLEGVSGDAVGRKGYGIHGTIEPESIGKAVSLGCVRMLNEDVASLYALLLPGKSTVTILP